MPVKRKDPQSDACTRAPSPPRKLLCGLAPKALGTDNDSLKCSGTAGRVRGRRETDAFTKHSLARTRHARAQPRSARKHSLPVGATRGRSIRRVARARARTGRKSPGASCSRAGAQGKRADNRRIAVLGAPPRACAGDEKSALARSTASRARATRGRSHARCGSIRFPLVPHYGGSISRVARLQGRQLLARWRPRQSSREPPH